MSLCFIPNALSFKNFQSADIHDAHPAGGDTRAGRLSRDGMYLEAIASTIRTGRNFQCA
jgi:hypothetical protein